MIDNSPSARILADWLAHRPLNPDDVAAVETEIDAGASAFREFVATQLNRINHKTHVPSFPTDEPTAESETAK